MFETLVAQLYISVLARAPDPGGLAYWSQQLESGAHTVASMLAEWLDHQPEVRDAYPDDMPAGDFVKRVYQNVLARDPDEGGAAYWLDELESGAMPRDRFIHAIINAVNAQPGGSDRATLDHRTEIGLRVGEAGLADAQFGILALRVTTANPDTLQLAGDLLALVQDDATVVASALSVLAALEPLSRDPADAQALAGLRATLDEVLAQLPADRPDVAAEVTSAFGHVVAAAAISPDFVGNPAELARGLVDNPGGVARDADTVVNPPTPRPQPNPGPDPDPTPEDLVDFTDGVIAFAAGDGTIAAVIESIDDGLTASFVRGDQTSAVVGPLEGATIELGAGQTLLLQAEDLRLWSLLNSFDGPAEAGIELTAPEFNQPSLSDLEAWLPKVADTLSVHYEIYDTLDNIRNGADSTPELLADAANVEAWLTERTDLRNDPLPEVVAAVDLKGQELFLAASDAQALADHLRDSARSGHTVVFGETQLQGTVEGNTFVWIGVTAEGQYEPREEPAGFFDVQWPLNARATADATDGVTLIGHGDNDVLHVYGTIDLSGLTLEGVETIVVHSDVTFGAGQLEAAGIAEVTSDGSGTIRFQVDESGAEVDLAALSLSGIGQLDVGDGVTAVLDQAALDAVATVSSDFQNAKIRQAGDTVLDFAGKYVFGGAEVIGADDQPMYLLADGEDVIDVGGVIEALNVVIAGVNSMFVNTPFSAFHQDPAILHDYELMCDLLAGQQGKQVILGREGVQNFMSGGDGFDTLLGAEGSTNFIYVGEETADDIEVLANSVHGGEQRDFILGDAHSDMLLGRGGDDFIAGMGGDDHFVGGTGNDFLDLGEGADTVYFEVPGVVGGTGNGLDFILGEGFITGAGGDTLSFGWAGQAGVFEGVDTDSLYRADLSGGLQGLANQAAIVLTNPQLGDADGLQAVLRETELNEQAFGNRVLLWSISDHAGAVGVGLLSKTGNDSDLVLEALAVIGGLPDGRDGYDTETFLNEFILTDNLSFDLLPFEPLG